MTEETTLETGGCLCGDVRYAFPRTDVLSAHHCHCKDCQKSTGSGKATILFIPVGSLNLMGELKTFTVVGSQGSHVTRGFCATCGSPLISYVAEMPDIKFIKVDSLDDSSWVEITSSFWQKTATNWSPVDDAHPAFAANPEA